MGQERNGEIVIILCKYQRVEGRRNGNSELAAFHHEAMKEYGQYPSVLIRGIDKTYYRTKKIKRISSFRGKSVTSFTWSSTKTVRLYHQKNTRIKFFSTKYSSLLCLLPNHTDRDYIYTQRTNLPLSF